MHLLTATPLTLGATLNSLIMQYAKIEMTDGLEMSCQQMGEELERELEKLEYQVSIPTSADWGYVFRTKSNGQTFDISVIPLSGDSFGIAIEPEKGLLSDITRYFKQPDIKGIKEWIEEILAADVGAKNVQWFTANEWTATFGKNFWDYTPE